MSTSHPLRIGFVASIQGKEYYDKYYQKIINHCQNSGHTIKHLLHLSLNEVESMTSLTKDKLFHEFHKELLDYDLIIIDCSYASIDIGFRISHYLSHGKTVILLHAQESDAKKRLAMLDQEDERLLVYEYTHDTLPEVLNDAIHAAHTKIEKRFTIIFPSELFARLELVSQKKKTPKAVYIRNLIEKALLNESLESIGSK